MKVLAANYSNGGARLTQVPARFKTVVGVSYTIALKFEHGRPTRSRIDGTEQMMYTLTTGETAYFPMNVGEAIESLTLAPGQPFTICHHGGGNWDVERVAPELPAPAAPPYTPPAPSAPRKEPASDTDAHHSAPVGDSAPQSATKLEHALKTAIAAAASAEKYAAEIGYQVRFDADMITRQALTVLINMEGGRK